MSVCPRSKRKTSGAINTKLGPHIVYGGASAYIGPELQRKVKVIELWSVLPASLHVDMTA